MNPLINTVKELLLSKDINNRILASEILKTYPILIDTTILGVQLYWYGYGNGNGYGNV